MRSLNIIDTISEWSGKVFRFLILALMTIVLFEVVSRYIFNNPTKWVYETSLYLFGAIIMLGGAYALFHKSHVSMDALYGRLSSRVQAILDISTFIFFCIFVVILLWKGWDMTWKALQFMERTDSSWAPLIWPSRVVIPIGAILLLLQGLAKFIRDIIFVMRKKSLEH